MRLAVTPGLKDTSRREVLDADELNARMKALQPLGSTSEASSRAKLTC
jgi:hypothetical protein